MHFALFYFYDKTPQNTHDALFITYRLTFALVYVVLASHALFLFPLSLHIAGWMRGKKKWQWSTQKNAYWDFSLHLPLPACLFFFGKAGNGRCAEAEKESTIEKERKT
jgi:hypothetical protein